MESYDKVDNYRDKNKEKIVKVNNIDSFRPLNNNVLVKPDMSHTELRYKSLKLVLDVSYEVGKHAPNKGEVIRVPKKFHFDKKSNRFDAPEWETTIEIEEGDKVYFDYLTAMECSWISCDGEIYYIIPYQMIYMAKREERVIPLNGYVLCDVLYNEEKFLDHTIEKEDKKYGVVAYIGSPNIQYKELKRSHGDVHYIDDPSIKVGDKVRFTLPNSLYLEQPEHASFDGDKMFKVVQRRFMAAIVVD